MYITVYTYWTGHQGSPPVEQCNEGWQSGRSSPPSERGYEGGHPLRELEIHPLRQGDNPLPNLMRLLCGQPTRR